MSSAIAAPATYGRPSRKGKKAWRKNVDVTQIQQGLEDLREEIIGGGVIAEKPAEQLFTTDLVGSSEIASSTKNRKLLTADQILAQRSVVPGLPGRKRKIEEVIIASGRPSKKNGQYVPHKELARLRNVADNANGSLQLNGDATYDVWGDAAPAIDSSFDFLEPPKPIQEPKTLRQGPVPLTTTGKPLAHVRKPDAGKSYNPLVSDWSALFEREGEAAVKLEQARLAAEEEAATQEARLEAEAAKVEAAEKDEYATDYESAWESEWDGFQSENEQQTHTKKLQKRKTPVERNKIKARKEREQQEKRERNEKQRRDEEARIKQIAKEVSARDQMRRLELSRKSRAQDGAISSDDDENEGGAINLRRNRFGKLGVPDAPLELTLPDELQDSLRRLKPEGNALTDRYRNLLINGKLEVRKKRDQWKKKQTFRTEKWTYKDWTLK